MFGILKKFREEPDPSLLDYKGACLSTMSKTELLDVAKAIDFKIEEVASAGAIDLTTENVCRLVHFALESQKNAHEAVHGPSQAKKKKEEPKSRVQALEQKLEDLEKKIKEKEAEHVLSDYERAKREAREEATKGAQVNIELLHEKLVLLVNAARKTNSDQKEKMAMTLSRFHAHKSKPSFAAALILKLLSSKEEEAVLEKEQKLMKRFGFDLDSNKQSPFSNITGMGFGAVSTMQVPFGGFSGAGYPFFPFNAATFQGAPFGYKAPRYSVQTRPRGGKNQGRMECFKCRKTGHLLRDCPLN